MDNKYIKDVSNLIENKKVKAEIIAELEGHLLDKIDFYTEIGYSAEEAERRACEEMGSAEETAVPLNKLHRKSELDNPLILNFFTGALLLFIMLLTMFIGGNFEYVNYTLPECVTVNSHELLYDVLSTLIFSAYAYLIILSNKHKNRVSAVVIASSLAVQVLLALSEAGILRGGEIYSYSSNYIMSLFQPMAYGAVITGLYGFKFYSTFFSFPNFWATFGDIDFPLLIAGFILAGVLTAWSIINVIVVFRHKPFGRKKAFRVRLGKAFNAAVCVLLAMNILYMLFSALAWHTGFTKQLDYDTTFSRTAIDCVLSADMGLSVDEQLSSINGFGFAMNKDEGNGYGYTAFSRNRNEELRIYSNYVSGKKYELRYDLKYINDILLKEYFEVVVDRDVIDSLPQNMTLDELVSSGLAYKAVSVNRWYSKGNDNLMVSFMVDNGNDDLYGEYNYAKKSIYFVNGKLDN